MLLLGEWWDETLTVYRHLPGGRVALANAV